MQGGKRSLGHPPCGRGESQNHSWALRAARRLGAVTAPRVALRPAHTPRGLIPTRQKGRLAAWEQLAIAATLPPCGDLTSVCTVDSTVAALVPSSPRHPCTCPHPRTPLTCPSSSPPFPGSKSQLHLPRRHPCKPLTPSAVFPTIQLVLVGAQTFQASTQVCLGGLVSRASHSGLEPAGLSCTKNKHKQLCSEGRESAGVQGVGNIPESVATRANRRSPTHSHS